MKRLLVVLLALVAVGSLLGNVLLFRRYSSNRPIVWLGDDSVILKDYRDRLELAAGRPVLTKMVLRKIVMNAAKKAGVVPSQEDLERRIAFINRRNPQALAAANQDPIKKQQLTEDLETDLALESLTIKDVKVSDAELKAFYQKNSKAFSAPQQSQAIMAVAGNKVDADAAMMLLRTKDAKGQLTIDAGTLARQPRIKVVGISTNINFKALPAAMQTDIQNRVSKLPAGSVFSLKVSDKGEAQYLIVRVERNSSAGVPPLGDVKTEVERACRLAKVQAKGGTVATLVKLYREANPRFEMSQYAPYFENMAALEKQVEDLKVKTSK